MEMDRQQYVFSRIVFLNTILSFLGRDPAEIHLVVRCRILSTHFLEAIDGYLDEFYLHICAAAADGMNPAITQAVSVPLVGYWSSAKRAEPPRAFIRSCMRRGGLARMIVDGKFRVLPFVSEALVNRLCPSKESLIKIQGVRSAPFFEFFTRAHFTQCCHAGDAIRELGSAVAAANDPDLQKKLNHLINHGGPDPTPLAVLCQHSVHRTDIIAALLEIGADPNCGISGGTPALLCALMDPNGANDRIAHLLLKHGARPDAAGPSGLTPAMFAASVKRMTPVLQDLVAHGADVFQRVDSDGESLLHILASNGCYQTMEFLLGEVKARIERGRENTLLITAAQSWLLGSTDSQQLTCLHSAVGQNNGAVCQLLLSFEEFLFGPFSRGHLRPLLRKQSFAGKSPIATAIEWAARESLTILAAHCSLSQLAHSTHLTTSATYLHLAAASPNASVMLPLIHIIERARAEVEGSSQKNHVDLAAQAVLEAETMNKETALLIAARMKHSQACQLLLHAGANANHCYPLHQACKGTSLEVVKVLINGGADVNLHAADADDARTPLMVAAHVLRADFVRLLIKHGADKSARGANNITAREVAIRSNAPDEVIEMLTVN